MAKKHAENLTTAKCKRIIRPLTSKLLSLTDLYLKYPSKFSFDVESCSDSVAVPSAAATFAWPESSSIRLASVCQFLSPELATAYKEMFAMFKNIIGALYPEPALSMSLTAVAALQLGKAIVLGTKSTYYKLNQASLFDQASIPQYLQKYRHELSDDIDDWLSMDPLPVMQAQKHHLLAGYLLHLVVFNLRHLLYPLVPVLVHWLVEQRHHRLARTLLSEFLMWLPAGADNDVVAELSVGNPSGFDPTAPLFWFLHTVGYWENLVAVVRLASSDSSLERYSAYDAVFLNVMFRSDRLSVTDCPDLNLVYTVLVANPQYPHNTQILTSVAAQLICHTKTLLDDSRNSAVTLAHLKNARNQTAHFIHAWLALRADCVFNSLDGGNQELFAGLADFLSYLAAYCGRVIGYLAERMLTTPAAKTKDALAQFKNLFYHIDMLLMTLSVLEAFYLDYRVLSIGLENVRLPSLATVFVDLMAPRAELTEVLELLEWISSPPDPNRQALALHLMRAFFREDSPLAEQANMHEIAETLNLPRT